MAGQLLIFSSFILPAVMCGKPGVHWIFSDRIKYTIPTETNALECECSNETMARAFELFGVMVVDYTVLFNPDNLDIFCTIKQQEQECELERCHRIVMWDMAVHFCHQHRDKFQQFVPCFQAAQPLTDRICHNSCWESGLELAPESGEKNRMFKRCYYKRCYLGCMELVVKQKCGSIAPAMFLTEFVANQTDNLLNMDHLDLHPICEELTPHSEKKQMDWRSEPITLLPQPTQVQPMHTHQPKEANSAVKLCFPFVLFPLFSLLRQ